MPMGGVDGAESIRKETNAFSPRTPKWSTNSALLGPSIIDVVALHKSPKGTSKPHDLSDPNTFRAENLFI
jgi:hypothetical protein